MIWFLMGISIMALTFYVIYEFTDEENIPEKVAIVYLCLLLICFTITCTTAYNKYQYNKKVESKQTEIKNEQGNP